MTISISHADMDGLLSRSTSLDGIVVFTAKTRMRVGSDRQGQN